MVFCGSGWVGTVSPAGVMFGGTSVGSLALLMVFWILRLGRWVNRGCRLDSRRNGGNRGVIRSAVISVNSFVHGVFPT